MTIVDGPLYKSAVYIYIHQFSTMQHFLHIRIQRQAGTSGGSLRDAPQSFGKSAIFSSLKIEGGGGQARFCVQLSLVN